MLNKESLIKIEVLTINKRIADQIKNIHMGAVLGHVSKNNIEWIGYFEYNAFYHGSSPYVLVQLKDTQEVATLLTTNVEQLKRKFNIASLPQIFVK